MLRYIYFNVFDENPRRWLVQIFLNHSFRLVFDFCEQMVARAKWIVEKFVHKNEDRCGIFILERFVCRWFCSLFICTIFICKKITLTLWPPVMSKHLTFEKVQVKHIYKVGNLSRSLFLSLSGKFSQWQPSPILSHDRLKSYFKASQSTDTREDGSFWQMERSRLGGAYLLPQMCFRSCYAILILIRTINDNWSLLSEKIDIFVNKKATRLTNRITVKFFPRFAKKM